VSGPSVVNRGREIFGQARCWSGERESEDGDVRRRVPRESRERKTIGQLIGGAAVLFAGGFGAVFAYLQFSQQRQASRDLEILAGRLLGSGGGRARSPRRSAAPDQRPRHGARNRTGCFTGRAPALPGS
jgi:hypothetical protein